MVPYEVCYQYNQVLLYFQCYFKGTITEHMYLPKPEFRVSICICVSTWGRRWGCGKHENLSWCPLTSGLRRWCSNLHLIVDPWQLPIQTDWLGYIVNLTIGTRTIARGCTEQLQTWEKHESQPTVKGKLANRKMEMPKISLRSTQATGFLMKGQSLRF